MVKTKKSLPAPSDSDASMSESGAGATYQDRLQTLNAISKPLASKKLTKKIYKLIKKVGQDKSFQGGLKFVENKLKKNPENGLVILAGDVLPIEVYLHLPAVCEQKLIPYVFVPSKDDIGQAVGLKRSIVAAFIECTSTNKTMFDEIVAEVKELPIPDD